MKFLFSFLLTVCMGLNVHAQVRVDTILKPTFYNQWTEMMESDPKDKWSRYSANQRFQVFYRLSKLDLLKNKSAAVIGFYGNAVLTWLNGQPELELAAAGVNKTNADSFLYHVVVNDSIEIVPWQHPSQFRSNNNGTYAYLGKFASLHKLIKFEIYHTGQYADRKTIYYNNLFTPAPAIAQARLLYNDQYLFHPHKQHYIPTSKSIQIGGYEMLPAGSKKNPSAVILKEIQHRSFQWSDSINHIALSIKPTVLNEMYQVYLRYYTSNHSDTVFISNKWNVSSYSPNPQLMVNASYFKKPGNYELMIRAEVPDEFNQPEQPSQTSLFFSVKPSSVIQFSPEQVILYTGFLLLIGGTGFFYYRGRNKRQIEKKNQEKQMATLQLRAVRSQLNPHFMFNALSGIQNLMNKNEGNKASNYLSRFARITRQILKESEQDMTSIHDEIKLLEDYLLMEQLRFGFQYRITVNPEIDQLHTEIPSMLLQPLVENAVKHGVSGLTAHGHIDLSITQAQDVLILEVKDNGNGFSLTDKTDGHGLKLVKERIQLLNKLYPGTDIHFKVSSANGSCISTIALNHWI